MKVGIIDAEIIGKSKHRFPNLCCMKLSAYHKNNNDDVSLLLSYEKLGNYDIVYISKVFTDTYVPEAVLSLPNITYGGTGFFYDRAPSLPFDIEHTMPDYHLYDEWVSEKIKNGAKRIEFRYYLDYSIGYLTRGCFRGCEFCVNRNYKQSHKASPLSEFMDVSRPKLCFLDDNFFSYPKWQELITPVINSEKRFQFKQGLDERLLTEEKIIALSKWNYDKEVIFAFDDIKDKDLIVSKLELIRKTVPLWRRELKFYVFCGWDKSNRYDEAFWEKDIQDMFERISILRAYNAKPYIMRFEKVYSSEYSSFYAAVAAWCNQPSIFNSFSFRLFCQCRGMRKNGYHLFKRDVEGYLQEIGIKGSEWRAMEKISEMYPTIAQKYFDINNESDLSQWKNIETNNSMEGEVGV